ncbi:hypothetical protein [Dictyobacter arantiisoli]|uniref:Uncharacterized protein n=1 Tax=Dictyobacter arantiisoli TaxID=2014874 RepID=A0A5A5TJM2_9CHLR|nr:hypothetical protein [Dictyobacter arantiisoli]GCF11266.1 hypothetical protein KDI_48300 [Dictyobacter arantiisoli]
MCYHKKQLIAIEAARVANVTPVAQVIESPMTTTEASVGVVDDDLEALLAVVEQQHATAIRTLPEAAQAITEKLTSGQPISDLCSVGVLNQRNQGFSLFR